MKLNLIAAAAAATTLAFAGASFAQSTSGSTSAPGSTGATSSQYDQQTPHPDNRHQDNGSGTTMTPDNSGSTVSTPPSSMPAEVVPSSPYGSSNTSATPTYTYSTDSVMPTRSEVKSEAAAAVRSGSVAHGDSPTYPPASQY
jgi:hypothetical protein